MYELRKLWRGKISPGERYIHEGSPYWYASQKHSDALQALYAMFSPEAKKQYEQVEEMAMDMIQIDTEEAFIRGFQLGARLILDVLTEYRGSFCSLAEKQQIEK